MWSPSAPALAEPLTFPFEIVSNKIEITAMINHRKSSAQIDTGAYSTSITKKLADQSAVKPLEDAVPAKFVGAFSAGSSKFAYITTLELGDAVTLRNLPVFVRDPAEQNGEKFVMRDGRIQLIGYNVAQRQFLNIGMDLLRTHSLKIDFDINLITLSPRPLKLGPDSLALPMPVFRHSAYLIGNLDSADPEPFLLDTGLSSIGAININSEKDYSSSKIIDGDKHKVSDINGKEKKVQSNRIGSLHFSNLRLENPELDFAALKR
ncbi:MAG: retroviral-like aspartic protease family protein, partial [Candidatus Obscuribacterales bacterium]|nr:retroviral-like aspartic protease family protein [Candidatus Obscuribacterales bacterium]